MFYGYYNQTPIVIKCCRNFSSWKIEVKALKILNHPNIIKIIGRPESHILADKYTLDNYYKKNRNNCSPQNTRFSTRVC